MTMSEERARKAEKARERAAEAARRAKEAEAEAAEALREAEEAEAATQSEEPETAGEPDDESAEPEESEEPKVNLEKTTRKTDADETDGAETETGKTDTEDHEDEKPVARKPRRRRLRPPPLRAPSLGARSYTLIGVNLVLAGVLGWLLVTVQGMKDEDRAVRQVTFAAKQAAEDLSSYDFRTIDADLKRGTGHTTGRFRSDYTGMTTSVKSSATQQQAVVAGTALRTSVESVDGRRAVALVYLDQETAKAASAERTPSLYTLRLVMAKIDDRWLVSELQVM